MNGNCDCQSLKPIAFRRACSGGAEDQRCLCQLVFNDEKRFPPRASPEASHAIHTAPAKRAIFWGNQTHDIVPVICKGWAASIFNLSNGTRQILSILLPGDIVSSALLFGDQAPYFVEAITDVWYRTFVRADLQTRLLKQSDFFAKFAEGLLDEKARTDQLIIDLGRRTAEERIAALILNLQDRLARRNMVRTVRSETMKVIEIDFPLRQYHIADASGLTTTSVSKVLRDFRRAGIIKTDEGSLTIIDPVALRQRALLP